MNWCRGLLEPFTQKWLLSPGPRIQSKQLRSLVPLVSLPIVRGHVLQTTFRVLFKRHDVPGRHPSRHRIRGHVLGDDGARRDERVWPDADSRQKDHAQPDEAII